MFSAIKKFAIKCFSNWLMKKIKKNVPDEKKSETVEVKTTLRVVQMEHTKTIKGG